MPKEQWYSFPLKEYSTQTIKLLAMAQHIGVISPTEWDYWHSRNWSPSEMSKELWSRIKTVRGVSDDA